jgi:hypothetical protein
MEPVGRVIETQDPFFGLSVARLRKALGSDLRDSRIRHLCDAKTCNPQSEVSLIRRGKLEGPAQTVNVYLCVFGTIHVCTERACEHYGHAANQTCPISGIQYGAIISPYDRGNSFTWGAKAETQQFATVLDPRLLLTQSGSIAAVNPPLRAELKESTAAEPKKVQKKEESKKRSFVHRRVPNSELTEKAGGMVKLLLYSRHRIERNKDAIKTHHNQGIEANSTYIRQQVQNQQLPFWTDLYRLVGHYSSQKLPLVEFVFNQNLCDYYVSIIMQVWQKVLKYLVPPSQKEYEADGLTEIPPRPDFGDVCIGVLYAMRQGIRYGGHTLLPKDDFLLMNLPVSWRQVALTNV